MLPRVAAALLPPTGLLRSLTAVPPPWPRSLDALLADLRIACSRPALAGEAATVVKVPTPVDAAISKGTLDLASVRMFLTQYHDNDKFREEVEHCCLTSERARRVLEEFLYGRDKTPPSSPRETAAPGAPRPPPLPSAPQAPRCKRALDFDAVAAAGSLTILAAADPAAMNPQ